MIRVRLRVPVAAVILGQPASGRGRSPTQADDTVMVC